MLTWRAVIPLRGPEVGVPSVVAGAAEVPVTQRSQLDVQDTIR